MPKTNRDILKREAAQIYLGLERVMETTVNLKRIFDPVHPELAVALEAVLQGCFTCQDIVKRFWAEAWGQDDPRWESWI